MKKYLTIETSREGYSVSQCNETLTVEELIGYLEQWDNDTPVYFSNDNGYTYGSISFDGIKEGEEYEDEEE